VRVFALTGILSIGGGRAAFFYDALVTRRRWMRVDEFLQDFTLAQLLPGATFANLSITLGHRLAGVAGAFGGLAAVVVPGGVILVVLAAIYIARGLMPDVATLMRGMSAAVVGLVAVTTIRMARPALLSTRALAIAAATFIAVALLRLNTPAVIVVMAAIGLWLNRPERAQ
jgi:chromate transporter